MLAPCIIYLRSACACLIHHERHKGLVFLHPLFPLDQSPLSSVVLYTPRQLNSPCSPLSQACGQHLRWAGQVIISIRAVQRRKMLRCGGF